MQVAKDKTRTYPITFRLPEKLVEDLRAEAENVEVSLNTLVNQVFDRYMSWERHSSKVGLIPVTRPFLREAIQNIPDEKIKQIARNASKDALKELILITKGTFNLDSFIAVFNEWLRASLITHRYEYDGDGHDYVIHHELGEKWSLYLSELLIAICKDLINVKPKIEIRKSSISFSFSQTA